MEVFTALADPVRLRIVELLAERERTAGEVAGQFDISGPAISRHLRVLRECGVATYEQRAQQRIYRLDGAALRRAEEWMAGQRTRWERRLDRLGEHLDDMARAEEQR